MLPTSARRFVNVESSALLDFFQPPQWMTTGDFLIYQHEDSFKNLLRGDVKNKIHHRPVIFLEVNFGIFLCGSIIGQFVSAIPNCEYFWEFKNTNDRFHLQFFMELGILFLVLFRKLVSIIRRFIALGLQGLFEMAIRTTPSPVSSMGGISGLTSKSSDDVGRQSFKDALVGQGSHMKNQTAVNEGVNNYDEAPNGRLDDQPEAPIGYGGGNNRPNNPSIRNDGNFTAWSIPLKSDSRAPK